MTRFWQNWMIGFCLAVGLFGVVLAGGAAAATSGPVRLIFALLNGPGQFQLDPPMRFSLAVLGAVTIGWGITLLAAVQAAHRLGGKAAKATWRWITASVVSWYVIDTTLSVVTGFGLNAVPNTLYLAAFLIAVVRSGTLKRADAIH